MPDTEKRRPMAEDNIPIPDPSVLTTEALAREISHLRELMEGKFASRQALLEDKDRMTEQKFQSLKDLTDEVNLRNQQRFDAQTKALDAAFLAQQTAVAAALNAAEKGVQTAMVASEKAVTKAETAAEKRFDAISEFRAAFNDLVAQQMPRLEAETRINALADKLDSRLTDMAVKTDELRSFASKAFLTGGIALIVSVISVFITLITFLNLH